MNLLDILIAKKKSFTGETESLVRRANAAMAQANTVAEKLEQAVNDFLGREILFTYVIKIIKVKSKILI